MSRPASFFERYYIHRDTTGVMNRGFNVSVQYPHHISDALLSNALQSLIPKHYYFYSNAFRKGSERAGLLDHGQEEDAKNGGKNYEIRPVSRVLYSELVQKMTVEHFDDAVFEQLSHVRIPVNVQKPSYYLTLLQESSGSQYVVFSSNHIFFDGTSAVHFMQDLAHELAHAASDSPVEVLFESHREVVSVEPAGDAKCALYRSSRWYQICTLFKLMVPDFLLKVYRSYCSSKYPNLFKYPLFNVASFQSGSDSVFQMVRFNAAETAQILQKCRVHQTTLTPLVTAQLVKCVEEAFLPHLGRFSSSVSVAVNGRRFYPEVDLRYGLYIAGVSEYLSPKDSVWAGAAKIAGGLGQCLQTRRPFMLTGLLEQVNIWDYMQSRIETGERGTVEVSNVGMAAIPEQGWAPVQAYFSQSVTDTHFVCSCISTKNGGLNIMVAYHKQLEKFEWQGKKTAPACVASFRQALLG